MKVMHIVPAMDQGGVESVVCDLNRIVVNNGWESVVVSKGGRLTDRIIADGGRHIIQDVKSKNPFSYIFRAWRLRCVLRKEHPDLVCVHSRVPAWLFVWANRTLGLKWVTYAHGANSVSRYSEIMTKGDLVITPSRFLADYLKENYGLSESKIRVINPAVDAVRFNPDDLDRSFVDEKRCEWGLDGNYVVMAIGRITKVKGYETLIKAVPSDARLVIIGGADDKHREYLQSLKRIAGANVVFAGSQSKIPECISMADVVVSANTSKPESFGLSMAEALMMGKPVVAKAFGGALDVVKDGIDGVLTPSGDFAEAIAKVRKMTFVGLREKAIARFAIERMARETVSVYKNLI